jgi:antitoxin HicB
MVRYPVALESDGDTVLVSFPDFPEAHTFGDDEEEALARAEDALLTILDAYIRDRHGIPAPSRAGGPHVALSGLVCAKLGLYGAMRASGIGKAELARRLGCHLPQVDRLLDLGHASRLDKLEQALQAIGRRLAVTVVPARSPARGTRRRSGTATRSKSTRSRRLRARP